MTAMDFCASSKSVAIAPSGTQALDVGYTLKDQFIPRKALYLAMPATSPFADKVPGDP